MMGLPRLSLGGTQVRTRQSLFTSRHWTLSGEPGAPGFSAAASETQGVRACVRESSSTCGPLVTSAQYPFHMVLNFDFED
jgi:hypothetical protein